MFVFFIGFDAAENEHRQVRCMILGRVTYDIAQQLIFKCVQLLWHLYSDEVVLLLQARQLQGPYEQVPEEKCAGLDRTACLTKGIKTESHQHP